MASQKNIVFERLFNKNGYGVVTLTDVDIAIREMNTELGSTLSTKNVANFYKDYTRVARRANNNWPASLRSRRVTARKADRSGECFEFVEWPASLNDPFVDDITPKPNTPTEPLAVSISARFRRQGCRDESYIASLADKIGLFSYFLQTLDITEVETVHFGKKARAEIDVIICGRDTISGEDILVAVEVKSHTESIVMGQLAAQSAACAKMAAERNINAYYMVAMKPVRTDGGCGIFICASQKLYSEAGTTELQFCDGIIYELDVPIFAMVGLSR